MLSRTVAVALSIATFAVGCATMKLPGQSIASSSFQSKAFDSVMTFEEMADNNVCKQRKVINTEIVDPPKNPGKDPWVEKWTVDRCGNMAYYKVVFKPKPNWLVIVSVWK